MRLAFADAVLNVHGPVNEQAVAELPAALAALRAEHGIGDGPIGVLGGSAGAGIAGAVVVEGVAPGAGRRARQPARACSARSWPCSPAASGSTTSGRPSPRRWPTGWTSSPGADGFAGIPVRLVVGADDDADAFLHPAEQLRDTLTARGTAADLHVVEGMGHALAEEPGVEPAPQTAHAAEVDRLAVAWLAQALELA